jgi:RNAse (barnase) inhibitor barstar
MRKAWLEVVALSSFRRDITDSGDRLFVLDGRPVTDEAGFYCAIGEAVNGPGGYFGWNLSALNDCLKGHWGAKPGFTLRWEDSIVARHSLTRAINSEGSFFSVVVDIFNERGVDVILQ